MSRNRYFLSIAELANAHGEDPRFAWQGVDPAALAQVLRQALREDELFQRWRASQAEPDTIDERLGATDPQAQVDARLVDLHTEIELVTDLSMRVLRHRLDLLIGKSWQLRDLLQA